MLSAQDLSADGLGGGDATAAQALQHIAARLRSVAATALAAPNAGARAGVSGSGNELRFTGLAAGDEGAFTITATVTPLSSGGVAAVSAPDLTVTGRINGGALVDNPQTPDVEGDLLTLRAHGGDITLQGAIGGGIGDSLPDGDFSVVAGTGYSTEQGRGAVSVGVGGSGHTLTLTGDFVKGDQIVVRGVAGADVVYIVDADDLTAAGDGSGGTATPEQVRQNVASSLAASLTERATGAAAGATLVSAAATGAAVPELAGTTWNLAT